MKLRRRLRDEPPLNKSRLAIAMIVFCGVYAVIGGRLMAWGTMPEAEASAQRQAEPAPRPNLLDRNGEVLATDIRSASVFAEPGRIRDMDVATERLAAVLPGLDGETVRKRLSQGGGIAWIKRNVTPAEAQAVSKLGLDGIGLRTEKRRYYPGGSTASHVVGHVDADNRGVAGMEKFVDLEARKGRHRDAAGQPEPVRLSVDLRVQHVMRDELASAMKKYQATAAGGVVLDVETGEVVAMASLPDYDPNNPDGAMADGGINRMSAATYEMGSTFKTFTTAMALESGKVDLTDTFDARAPIRIDGFTISDTGGQKRSLTVPEIFMYSSNIGAAREAEAVGVAGHRAFLSRIGLLSRLETELPETATPVQPRQWQAVHSITASFGHGVATTPLQTAAAGAALMNGGYLVRPTFLARSKAEAEAVRVPVVSSRTSDEMRYLFRLNGEQGSGKSARVDGFDVGGKTGTAEKMIDGRYRADKRLNAYMAAFPMASPRYVVFVMIDEPQRAAGDPYATAGWNAAPTTANIIRRAAAFLDVRPDFGNAARQLLVSY